MKITLKQKEALNTLMVWLLLHGPDDVMVKGYGLLSKAEIIQIMVVYTSATEPKEYSISEQMLFNTLRRMYIESIKEPNRYK